MTSLSTSDCQRLKLHTVLVKADAYLKFLEIYKADYVRTLTDEIASPDRCQGELRESIVAQVMSLPETTRLELLTTFIQSDVSVIMQKQLLDMLAAGTNAENAIQSFDKCTEHVIETKASLQAEYDKLSVTTATE